MNPLVRDLQAYRRRAGGWLTARQRGLRHTSGGVLLVRSIAVVAALAGGLAAVPDELVPLGDPRVLAAIAIGSAGVGLLPRTRWVTLYAIGAIGLFAVATVIRDAPVELWRVAVLTAALYLMHTSAALAAVLPYDTVIASGVLTAWARRTAGVLAAALLPGLAVLAAMRGLPPAGSWFGPVAGAAVAAALVGLLAWHLRQR